MSLFPDPQLIREIKNKPQYKEALKAFSSGDNERGQELLNQLLSSESMKKVNKFYDDNKDNHKEHLKQQSIIMIDKNEPIPDGYSRNSFTDKTCITTQQRDLSEWKNITAIVMYENKSVYEDHYIMRFTTENALYDIKKKNPKSFIGIIVSSNSVEHTINKFKKNSLYLLIDSINIELRDVDYSVLDLLQKLLDIAPLTEITIKHTRDYSKHELITIKKLFGSTSWTRLNFIDHFDLSK